MLRTTIHDDNMNTDTSFTFFWINADHEHYYRQLMYTNVVTMKLHHVRIPAVTVDGSHCYGNALRARTLSHVRAIRRVSNMPQYRLACVLIAEDTLAFTYMPHWLHSLRCIVQNAPVDWGILQLSYTVPSAEMLKEIMHSAHAPYIPWRIHRLGGTVCYIMHPRGRADIRRAVRAYKQNTLTAFSPDHAAEHLFALTVTYTFHYPLFHCHKRRVVHQLQFQRDMNEMVQYTNTVRKTAMYCGRPYSSDCNVRYVP
jgi:hypothetical protein